MEVGIVFPRHENTEEIKNNVDLAKVSNKSSWNIIWSICASFMTIPFGLMLGWPSSVYPRLIKPSSPILISMDESALITGFLMIGNLFGTLFSPLSFFGPKCGIIFSTSLMTCGWFVMWQARDIYWLLGSRFLIGFGNGYGVAQIKIYINEICQAGVLVKFINMNTLFGLLGAFAFGPFVDFRSISIISLIITVGILLLIIFLPPSHGRTKADKIEMSETVLKMINSQISVNGQIEKTKNIKNYFRQLTFIRIIENRILRSRLIILLVLIFCQQFSGAPATLVYTQIFLERSQSPYPIYFSILYAVIFFFTSFLGIFIPAKCNKKRLLLFSSVTVSLVIVINICLLYFRINENYWSYSSIVGMLIYITVHTLGLGCVPFSFIPEFFPKECQRFVTNTSVIFHSILAIIITKLFQVLIDRHNLCTPFYMFLCVSLLGTIFVLISLPTNKNSEVFVCS